MAYRPPVNFFIGMQLMYIFLYISFLMSFVKNIHILLKMRLRFVSQNTTVAVKIKASRYWYEHVSILTFRFAFHLNYAAIIVYTLNWLQPSFGFWCGLWIFFENGVYWWKLTWPDLGFISLVICIFFSFFSVSFEDKILKICKTGLSKMPINIGIFFKDVEHINWILLGSLYE